MSTTVKDTVIANISSADNNDVFSVSELINELQKIPNQNAIVFRESCGYMYPIRAVLCDQSGNVHLV